MHNDAALQKYGIHLRFSRIKNINKNLIAETANEELGLECLHVSSEGSLLSKVTLPLVTVNLNFRICKSGLSVHEIRIL